MAHALADTREHSNRDAHALLALRHEQARAR